MSVLWEHLNVLADVYFTQVRYSPQLRRCHPELIAQYMLVSGGASNPAKALLEGMQHKDPFVQVRQACRAL